LKVTSVQWEEANRMPTSDFFTKCKYPCYQWVLMTVLFVKLSQ